MVEVLLVASKLSSEWPVMSAFLKASESLTKAGDAVAASAIARRRKMVVFSSIV